MTARTPFADAATLEVRDDRERNAGHVRFPNGTVAASTDHQLIAALLRESIRTHREALGLHDRSTP